MSRIGKMPVVISDKVMVSYKDRVVTIKGSLGSLDKQIHPFVDLKIDDKMLNVEIISEDKKASAFQGMTRALLANMVEGVTTGFQRSLKINGIGYRAELKGSCITLNIGYSNPVEFNLPEGVTAKVEKTVIDLSSIDKDLLGRTAASIRELRPPEPYKGKGIKYAEEHIIKKAGKAGAK